MPQAESRTDRPLIRWKRIFERDKHRCVYCGVDLLSDLPVYHSSSEDHLYPKSSRRRGIPKGVDDERNLVAACYLCNTLKSDFIPKSCIEDQSVAAEFFSETEDAFRFVRPEKHAAYIELVRDHIESERSKRETEMNRERMRVGWNASSKTH